MPAHPEPRAAVTVRAAAPVLVRPLRPEELDAALALYADVAAEGRWIGGEAPVDLVARRRQFEVDHVHNPSGALLCAEAPDGQLVGLLMLKGVQVMSLGMLVHRDWRGRGVGRRLLQAGLDWARQHGVHKVALEVWPHNAPALALYERFGFVREGLLRRHYRRKSGELWDCVLMGLMLDEGRA